MTTRRQRSGKELPRGPLTATHQWAKASAPGAPDAVDLALEHGVPGPGRKKPVRPHDHDPRPRARGRCTPRIALRRSGRRVRSRVHGRRPRGHEARRRGRVLWPGCRAARPARRAGRPTRLARAWCARSSVDCLRSAVLCLRSVGVAAGLVRRVASPRAGGRLAAICRASRALPGTLDITRHLPTPRRSRRSALDAAGVSPDFLLRAAFDTQRDNSDGKRVSR